MEIRAVYPEAPKSRLVPAEFQRARAYASCTAVLSPDTKPAPADTPVQRNRLQLNGEERECRYQNLYESTTYYAGWAARDVTFLRYYPLYR